MVLALDYPNFKNEVTKTQGDERHMLYMEVWRTMLGAENFLKRKKQYGSYQGASYSSDGGSYLHAVKEDDGWRFQDDKGTSYPLTKREKRAARREAKEVLRISPGDDDPSIPKNGTKWKNVSNGIEVEARNHWEINGKKIVQYVERGSGVYGTMTAIQFLLDFQPVVEPLKLTGEQAGDGTPLVRMSIDIRDELDFEASRKARNDRLARMGSPKLQEVENTVRKQLKGGKDDFDLPEEELYGLDAAPLLDPQSVGLQETIEVDDADFDDTEDSSKGQTH
jgi:hypothetical protein